MRVSTTAESTSALVPSEPIEELGPPERLTVAVVEQCGDWSSFKSFRSAIAKAGAALAGHPACAAARGREASVVLADDALLRSLNRRYRGCDAATNVLSFPFQPGPGAEQGGYLGDVVLAAETIAREAADLALAPDQHLQHLVVHGLLHLLGFDHATDGDAAVMEHLEVQILAALGIADPYAFPPAQQDA